MEYNFISCEYCKLCLKIDFNVIIIDLFSLPFQLLDLRQVMARMLGLDVNSLAVPDYEIIARLEKLILANQSNAATVVALDTALEDVSEGFRVGYENATRTVGRRSRSPLKVTRSMGSLRTRSASPAQRDHRKY